MAKLKTSEAQTTDATLVAEAIGKLTDELHVVREALDEFRGLISWALKNDKFRTDRDEILEVHDGLNDSIRETVREECGTIRKAMDQFSTDVSWAARKITEAAESVKQRSLFDHEQ